MLSQIKIQRPQIDYNKVHQVIKYAVSGEDSVLCVLVSINGGNRTWDFSGLEFENLGSRRTEYLDGKALSGISDFNKVSFVISETYADTVKFSLYILNDTSLQTIGELSNQKDSATFMDIIYDPPIASALFPVEFGSEAEFNSSVFFGDFNFKLKFRYIVDSWGELITPMGKHNVLRIKLGGTGEFAGNPITVNNYLFVTQEHIVIPLAEIQEIVYAGVSTYSASYRKFD